MQPVKPDYLVTAHHRPVRLRLHLLEHGQFQGVLGLAQAVPGFHRRVGVGQKSAVVIHQTGHVGVEPAGAAHPFHQIIQFYRHLQTPQGMSRPIQQGRSQADGLMIRGIKKLGRRDFGHPGGQASAPPALLDNPGAARRRLLPLQADLAHPRLLPQLFQDPVLVVRPLAVTAGVGQGLDPLQGVIQAHIHMMGRPLQSENGGFLPLLIETAPDIKIAPDPDGRQEGRHRQDQKDYQALL